MERLTEREPYWLGEEFWTSAREPDEDEIDRVYEKLKQYEDLEEQGLLLRLPCKRGDIVYAKNISGEYEKAVVNDFLSVGCYGFCLTARFIESNEKLTVPFSEFGKKVFKEMPEEE